MFKRLLLILSISLSTISILAQNPNFRAVVLGCRGGVQQSNLSCYLISDYSSEYYIALDGGSILTGVEKGLQLGSFDHLNLSNITVDEAKKLLVQKHISSYLISHPHLDHISGMVILSTDDVAKKIYASKWTWEFLLKDVFNWKIWPNFTNQGMPFHINQYEVVEMGLGDGVKDSISGLRITPFPLSHGFHYQSTAFLIESGENAILYFGDTGADLLEGSHDMRDVWESVAKYQREGRLKGIFLECSYSNAQSNDQLYGHLKPEGFLSELNTFAEVVGTGRDSNFPLEGLKIVITHIKPKLGTPIDTIVHQIRKELLPGEEQFKCKFIFPKQGEEILF